MNNSRLQVKLGDLILPSPLLTASGTSGSSDEIRELAAGHDVLAALGAFVSKGVTLEPREGNREPRVVETRTGLLNSIGLQNSGAEFFMREELPRLAGYGLKVLVNISAGDIEEFGRLGDYLMEHDRQQVIAGLEINVSCPNIKAGGAAFGADPGIVEQVVRKVRRSLRRGVVAITKLSPNVTDITEPARAAVAGGTDVLSMINTIRGMAIDVDGGRYFLGNGMGGLSGPAIKPVGVYMVHQCFHQVPECRSGRVPIIGIGGISGWRDALEYIMAGASAVGVGTAWFVNPLVFPEIRDGLAVFCRKRQTSIMELVGSAHA